MPTTATIAPSAINAFIVALPCRFRPTLRPSCDRCFKGLLRNWRALLFDDAIAKMCDGRRLAHLGQLEPRQLRRDAREQTCSAAAQHRDQVESKLVQEARPGRRGGRPRPSRARN